MDREDVSHTCRAAEERFTKFGGARLVCLHSFGMHSFASSMCYAEAEQVNKVLQFLEHSITKTVKNAQESLISIAVRIQMSLKSPEYKTNKKIFFNNT